MAQTRNVARRFAAALLAALVSAAVAQPVASEVPTVGESNGSVSRDVAIVTKLLQRLGADVDLAAAKLAIDKRIDPSIDVPATLAQIDKMVATIRRMAGPSPTERQKLTAVRDYLYASGSWNDDRPYQYDLNDPLGENIRNKLLPVYLASRRGNCVTMPILFVILAGRLDLPVAVSTAPLHILVKYTDRETGKSFNIETTSGAHVARDAWYREKMPMTDAAIANGVYLAPLSRRETIALMADTLVEYQLATGRYEEAIAVADQILSAYPQFVHALVSRGTAAAHLLEDEYYRRYPTEGEIPVGERAAYLQLININRSSFDRAEALGWRAAP